MVLANISFGQTADPSIKVHPAVEEAMTEHPEEFQRVYLYVGGSEDWNQISANWDHKRVDLAQRALTLRQRLPEQRKEELQQIMADLMLMEGVLPNSVQRYWITPVIQVTANGRALQALSNHPLIQEILPLPTLMPDEDQALSMAALPVPGGREPAHDLVGATDLWEMGYSGYGRKVYIIDTGVDPGHPALRDRYWGNYAPHSQAWHEPGGSPSAKACGGHGTFVAGVILGYQPTSLDTIGMAPEALWMASPAAGSAPCVGVDMLGALQWALDPDGDSTTVDDLPDVINNSWSIQLSAPNAECSGPYRDAFAALEAAGIAVVFSAGNSGPGPQTIPSPKNLNINPVNVFTVGSINGNHPDLILAGSSSRGPSTCLGGPDSIKPEVVAPGVNVRTTGLNGFYVNVSGTSFAAPQVSGALLLLKEAFPTLSGKQLLESLYYSATDLGVAGEDNEYGNGLISLPAAFAYLQGLGHIPAAVSDSNDVSVSGLVLGEEQTCDSVIFPIVTLENRGSNAIQQVLALRSRQGVIDTLVWQGNLLPDAIVFWDLGADTISLGNNVLQLTAISVNGKPDRRYLDNRVTGSIVRFPSEIPPLEIPPLLCPSQLVRISAQDHATNLVWYANRLAQDPIAMGGDVLLGPFLQDTVVYVARRITSSGGMSYDFLLNGNHSIQDAAIIFDAEYPLVLHAVQVHSQGDGNRIVQLKASDGTVLIDTTIFLNFGLRRMPLELHVPAGKGFQLSISSPNVRLFAATSDVQYPYEGEGFSLTGSSLGPGVYPYFFDWEVSYEGCRQAVELLVGSAAVQMDFSPRDTTLYLALGATSTWKDQSTGTIASRWDFGDGKSASGGLVTHAYDSAGIFSVHLQGEGADGCVATLPGRVEVLDGPSNVMERSAWQLEVYPNPAEDDLVIVWDLLPGPDLVMNILDAQGRTVWTAENKRWQGKWELNVGHLAEGSYVLHFRSGHHQFHRRIQIGK